MGGRTGEAWSYSRARADIALARGQRYQLTDGVLSENMRGGVRTEGRVLKLVSSHLQIGNRKDKLGDLTRVTQ